MELCAEDRLHTRLRKLLAGNRARVERLVYSAALEEAEAEVHA